MPRKLEVWTPEFEAYLVTHGEEKSAYRIAQELGLNVQTVLHHYKKHGFRTNRRKGGWTDEQNAYLRENFGIVPKAEIAKALGKTERALAERISNKQLYHDVEIQDRLLARLTDEQKARLEATWGQNGYNLERLSKELGLSKEGVKLAHDGIMRLERLGAAVAHKAKTEAPKIQRGANRVVEAKAAFVREFDLQVGDIVVAPFERNTTNDREVVKHKFEVIGIYPHVINCQLVGGKWQRAFPKQLYTCGLIKKVVGNVR